MGVVAPPIALLPDGRRALVGAKGLHAIDAETGQLGKVVLPDMTVTALAVPPDARFIVAGLRYPARRPSIVVALPARLAPLRQFPSRRASRPHDSGSRARWQSGHLGSQSVSCRAMASRMVAKESA
jgi:hypothetical protein